MRARQAILEGRCANPLLGLIIEENGELPEIQRVTKLKPLTPFVKEKIFKHPPTDRQVEAIEIALNTPDIALIQGPPGTGKTTVVTAILERLNEEYDKTKSIRGQVLVSGFQHDAVENIVARLSVNALPAVKFGRRSGDSEFTEDAVTEKINKWCSNVAENIRNKNPQIAQTEDQVRLAELFVAYSLCPSKNNTISLMKRILDLPRDVISEDITSEAEEIINSLKTELKPNDPSTLRLIRALRVSEAAFKDDGAARAVDLLDKIEDEFFNPDLKALEKAARWQDGKPLDFLQDQRKLKGLLLDRYLPLPDFRTEKPRQDVLELVAKVSQLLEKKLNSTNKRDAILAEFLHELEDNPDGVREAIEDYNFVYAATTQQAVGKNIIRSKNKNVRYDQRTEMIKYDTVIIDEAARTSPRDLLIPMSQAEKRIILVGDHRQLPHLIDEEVARALEGDDSSGPPVNVDFVKKSMFEYLFNRLKKMEEKDGIKRTVTLDAQYRTHPLLGDFASNNFYKKYEEGYRSPLGAELFEQRLQGIENKAAVWIDVPNHQGREERLHTGSRKRIAEASKIAEYVNKWIGSEEGSGLSFGVISFYKAQVFAAYKALQEYGITERAQDGTWQICQEYRFLENGDERLRIGTVDAFQGMEFDIVFLSIVRTQEQKRLASWIKKEKNHERVKRGVFGHLMSENRLCVSMSRQKKALITVGDSDLFQSQIAIDAVPALKNFYDLCHEKGVIL
jgi:superfamily I DNA and/or RNA helicase